MFAENVGNQGNNTITMENQYKVDAYRKANYWRGFRAAALLFSIPLIVLMWATYQLITAAN